MGEDEWLNRMHAYYVDRMPSAGAGVWAPTNSGTAADRRSPR